MKPKPFALTLALLLGLGCECFAREIHTEVAAPALHTVRITHSPPYWGGRAGRGCMHLGRYVDGTISFASATITGARTVPCFGMKKDTGLCVGLNEAASEHASESCFFCTRCRGPSTEHRLTIAQLDEIEALAKAIVKAAEGFDCGRKYRGKQYCRATVFIDEKEYTTCDEAPDDLKRNFSRLETYLDELPSDGALTLEPDVEPSNTRG